MCVYIYISIYAYVFFICIYFLPRTDIICTILVLKIMGSYRLANLLCISCTCGDGDVRKRENGNKAGGKWGEKSCLIAKQIFATELPARQKLLYQGHQVDIITAKTIKPIDYAKDNMQVKVFG